MYMRGLAAVGPIKIGGQAYSSITPALDAALASSQPVTSLSGDHVYSVTQFMGGWLLDGCPLNVIFGQGWISGQAQALKNAGIVPTCLVPGSSDYMDFYGTAGPAPTSPTQVVTTTGAGGPTVFTPGPIFSFGGGPTPGGGGTPAGPGAPVGSPGVVITPAVPTGLTDGSNLPGLAPPPTDYTPFLIGAGILAAVFLFRGGRNR